MLIPHTYKRDPNGGQVGTKAGLKYSGVSHSPMTIPLDMYIRKSELP